MKNMLQEVWADRGEDEVTSTLSNSFKMSANMNIMLQGLVTRSKEDQNHTSHHSKHYLSLFKSIIMYHDRSTVHITLAILVKRIANMKLTGENSFRYPEWCKATYMEIKIRNHLLQTMGHLDVISHRNCFGPFAGFDSFYGCKWTYKVDTKIELH